MTVPRHTSIPLGQKTTLSAPEVLRCLGPPYIVVQPCWDSFPTPLPTHGVTLKTRNLPNTNTRAVPAPYVSGVSGSHVIDRRPSSSPAPSLLPVFALLFSRLWTGGLFNYPWFPVSPPILSPILVHHPLPPPNSLATSCLPPPLHFSP